MNSATRILRIINSTRPIEDRVTVAAGWGQVFDVSEPSGLLRDHEIVHLVTELYKEVQLLRSRLSERGISQATFERHLQHVEEALSIKHLNSHWVGVKNRFTPELITAFEFMADLCGHEEDAIEPHLLAELRAKIKDLHEHITAGTLPAGVKSFLLHQLDILLRAVIEYPISGMAAFRQASHTAGADWAARAWELSAYRDDPAVNEVRSLWSTIWKWAKNASVVVGFGHLLLVETPEVINRIQELRMLLPPHRTSAVVESFPFPPEPPEIQGIEVEEADGSSGA